MTPSTSSPFVYFVECLWLWLQFLMYFWLAWGAFFGFGRRVVAWIGKKPSA